MRHWLHMQSPHGRDAVPISEARKRGLTFRPTWSTHYGPHFRVIDGYVAVWHKTWYGHSWSAAELSWTIDCYRGGYCDCPNCVYRRETNTRTVSVTIQVKLRQGQPDRRTLSGRFVLGTIESGVARVLSSPNECGLRHDDLFQYKDGKAVGDYAIAAKYAGKPGELPMRRI